MFRTAIAHSPRTRFLRSSRSLGALRPGAVAPSYIPALPRDATAVHSRSLVSTVLLSQEAYNKLNVNQLKAECKQRGLSTVGRKADLLLRLNTDDAHRHGAPMPEDMLPTSSSSKRGNSSLASLRGKDEPFANSKKSATKKTTASAPTSNSAPSQPQAKATPSAKTPPPAPASPAPNTEASPAGVQPTLGEGASIPHPPEIKPGQVQAAGQDATHQAAQDGIGAPEKLDPSPNPPGVPPQNEPAHPVTFKVQIPYEQPKPVPGPEIPIVTAYTQRPSQPSSEKPASQGPKVITATAHSDVSHALDVGTPSGEETAAADAISAAARSIKADFGLKGDLASQAGSLAKSVTPTPGRLSEVTSAITNEVASTIEKLGPAPTNAPALSARGGGSSSGSSNGKRPLNAEEKQGLFVLGGLVVGGFAAGGLAKPKKTEQH